MDLTDVELRAFREHPLAYRVRALSVTVGSRWIAWLPRGEVDRESRDGIRSAVPSTSGAGTAVSMIRGSVHLDRVTIPTSLYV